MDVMIDATITSANMIKTRNDVCIDKTSLKYMDFKTILSDLDAMMQADFHRFNVNLIIVWKYYDTLETLEMQYKER